MPQTPHPTVAGLALGSAEDALWHRLTEHRFDDPCHARPFSARLAQNQGWSEAYTQRVLDEYRRFLYLCLQRGGHACPSEAVDAAWHAHLLDSSVYFNDFCPRVLGRTLHHFTSRGGGDGARHQANYAATLHDYEQVFGAPPPADIWPLPAQRFAERTLQVSTRTHWVLPKPAWWSRRQRRRAAPMSRTTAVWLCVSALAVIGCTPGRFPFAGNEHLSGPQFLWFYVPIALLWWALGTALAERGRDAEVRRVHTAGLSVIEQAYLADGPVRVLWTALLSMLQRGEVKFDATRQRWQAANPPGAGTSRVERAVHQGLAQGGQPRVTLLEFQSALNALHQGLHARGLLTSPRRLSGGRHLEEHLYLAGWLALLAWGALRAWQGLQRGYPITWVLVAWGLSLVAYVKMRRVLPHRLTREGQAYLQGARSALGVTQVRGLSDPLMPLAVALVGAGALSADLLHVRQALQPYRQSDNGSGGCGGSGGTSDGGGGDGGGGCGGCGGCGG